MTDLEQQFTVPDDVMFRDLGGEAVLLNVATGRYFGLDETASRMWTLIGEDHSLEDVVTSLVEEYDVDRETVANDLLALVEELTEHRLLVPVGREERAHSDAGEP